MWKKKNILKFTRQYVQKILVLLEHIKGNPFFEKTFEKVLENHKKNVANHENTVEMKSKEITDQQDELKVKFVIFYQ